MYRLRNDKGRAHLTIIAASGTNADARLARLKQVGHEAEILQAGPWEHWHGNIGVDRTVSN